jgi:hypothetical protein
VSEHIQSGSFAKEMARFLVHDTYDNLMNDDAFLAYCDESVKCFMQAVQEDQDATNGTRFFK